SLKIYAGYVQFECVSIKLDRLNEDIPDGAVAVLIPDMPDVLSHVSMQARNRVAQDNFRAFYTIP
ncbi:hypothetical protein LOK49_LG12G00972, partial [Camellia lanceoleosa]